MLSLVKGFVKSHNFEKLSLMELGLLGVKVEESGDIFQVLCWVWFSQLTSKVGFCEKSYKLKKSKSLGIKL